jgi:hypothetical protein
MTKEETMTTTENHPQQTAVATKWIESTEADYWQALGCLPPAARNGLGFLLGEPSTLRDCRVTGHLHNTFHAFAERDGCFFKSAEPITIPEWRAVVPADVVATE